MAERDLQSRVEELIARPAPAAEAAAFTHFDVEENRRASELARELSEVAGESGTHAALDRAEELAEAESLGTVKHALKLFVTHDPVASTEAALPTPEIRESEPLPPAPGGADAALAVAPAPLPPRDFSRTTPSEEARLDWYREDPFANDHHHHWHFVYPGGGAPDTGRTQPRQGELFFYMHQQMLARYDTERLIAGLDRAEPLTDYDGPIREGYELEGYRPRPEGANFESDEDAATVRSLADAHDEAEAAIAAGEIELVGRDGQATGTVPLDENVLGCEVEASLWFPDPSSPRPAPLRYMSFHGAGHVLMAGAEPERGYRGPMAYFETAIHDPIFYRHHRRVDDLYASYQDRQPFNSFMEFAANAIVRDVTFALTRDIDGAEQPGFDFAAWGERSDQRASELITRFVQSNIVLSAIQRDVVIPDEWLEGVVHLTHEPFVWFLRVDNQAPASQDVTVRMFLALDGQDHDRRMWIELDKFRATLDPGENLVARPDARSSVVKRKGVDVPGAEPADPEGGEPTTWCDCGWPYTLLLPSGASTPGGSSFRLMVALTDWSKDHLGEPSTCGSMSFCGARNEYPDRRRMGYPFDRPFERSIVETIAREPSMTMRDLTVRCETLRPGGG